MKIVSEKMIFKGQSRSPTANSGFPAIAAGSKNTLFATWRVGSRKSSPDGKIWLSSSSDSGQTWTKASPIFTDTSFLDRPGTFFYGPLTALRPNSLVIVLTWVEWPDLSKPFVDPVTEEHLPTVMLISESQDGGKSWGPLREIDPEPYRGLPLVCGPIQIMPGGRWSCWFEVDKGPRWHHAAVKFSDDRGQSWTEPVDVAHDPSGRYLFWDQHCAVQDNGPCVATFWTYDSQAAKDVNVHMAVSMDGGNSWSRPRDTGIAGQGPCPIILSDGRLLLIYVDRFASHTIRAKLSEDFGKNWLEEDLVIYRHPAKGLSESNSGITASCFYTFGRPDALLNPDDTVSIVYYAGDEEVTGIYFTRLRV